MKNIILITFLTFNLAVLTVSAQKYVYDIDRTEFHDDMIHENVRRIIRLPSVNGLQSVILK